MLIKTDRASVRGIYHSRYQREPSLSVAFCQNMETTEPKENQRKLNLPKILLWAAGIASVATTAFLVFKKKKVDSTELSCARESVATISNYHSLIIKGLKDKFGIEAEPKNLKSVVGIEEFRGLIKQYSPADFSLGNPKSEDSKEFFKNVIEGKFRASLHSHSVFSDGRMTPQFFIDMAAQYADKVAQKIAKEDTRPPFLLALTDHDNFEGCQEIVKIIAQNPEKYKNLKFVSGSELSVKDGDKHFDLTALGVNPFDENLTKHVRNLKNNRASSARDFIGKVNDATGANLDLEELEKTQYKGKKTLQNRSGVVYIRNVLKVVLKQVEDRHHNHIKSLFKANNYSDKNTPDIDSVIDVVKQAGGEVSLTHPAKSFPECDMTWYQGLLQSLKNKGVTGIEANHQYTFEHHQEISNLEQINSASLEFAQKNDMFISGGTDSHKYDIFGHHHKISDELLKSFLE